MNSGKTIIVSNRLPVKLTQTDKIWKFSPSEGGLATGLNSIYKEKDSIWVGWPGAEVKDSLQREKIAAQLNEQNLFPVFLSAQEIEQFYDGFSNETLWPLFHYFPSYAKYDYDAWKAYEKVNSYFAQAVISLAEPGDRIWIHDYHLLLLPQLIRKELPDITIGFFQHIPFPSYEVFRLIPWRKELLNGILGSDLIGFHTHDDVRHFISAATRLLPLHCNSNEITINNREVLVDAFPMGIDFEFYRANVSKPKTLRNVDKLKQMIGDKKLILSIDRLDYSKGIPQRLKAFEAFLEHHPEERERVILLQMVVPSRDSVNQYATLKQEINRRVSEINGKFGSFDWQPIHYLYRSFPSEMISALYYCADVALVTPLRDGMNLVCKEYVASRINCDGVLILSEMAGAARELNEALIINPTDHFEVAKAMKTALEMQEDEKCSRMKVMQKSVQKFNINHWVANFMDRLEDVKHRQELSKTRLISKQIVEQIRQRYLDAKQRLLLLDYDGTLISFHNNPELAVPDESLIALIGDLAADERNSVVIISGRKHSFLEQWLGHLPIDIIAEHGAWMRMAGAGWKAVQNLSAEWKDIFRPILAQFEMRTPGSFIEEKDAALAWHFRNVDKGLGDMRSLEIVNNLKYMTSDYGLQILRGNKVLEIKSALVNKGKTAQLWLEEHDYKNAFVLAIGDDVTDEDTFQAMPPQAITIKVGAGRSVAEFSLNSSDDVRVFLQSLLEKDRSLIQKVKN